MSTGETLAEIERLAALNDMMLEAELPMAADRLGPEPAMLAAAVHEARRSDGATDEATGDALLDTSHDGLALDMGRKWPNWRHVALWRRRVWFDGMR